MSICLAFLYSPSVLPHITSETCLEVLAASHFLQLDSLSEYTFNVATSALARISNPAEIARWFTFLGGGEDFSGALKSRLNGGGNGKGNGEGGAGVRYGKFGRQLTTQLLDRVMVSLPGEIEAESASAEGTKSRLIELLAVLPFWAFKQALESSRFRAGDDMDRCECFFLLCYVSCFKWSGY